MYKKTTEQKAEMELLSEQELEAVVGGGRSRSQCEGDDGTPPPPPPPDPGYLDDNYGMGDDMPL